MSSLPEEVTENEASSQEAFSRDLLPYKLEIDGSTYTRERLGGQHKVAYTDSELNQIALLPDPVKFEALDDRELQVDVWQHNGQRYKEAGLSTVDQKYDDNGNIVDSGYTIGTTEIDGEEYPVLQCYFNPHLNSIDYVQSREGLYRDKREDIIDAVITLDQLKREGEIATAENTAEWEEVANELDVVCEEDIPIGNGEVISGGGVSKYGEISDEAKRHLGEEFRQALFENTTVQNSRDDIYFKDNINPRELVLETGLPSSAGGLVNTLKYNDKTGEIVVSDLGECGEAIFNGEKNRYEVRFDSVDEFTTYHGIGTQARSTRPVALDD